MKIIEKICWTIVGIPFAIVGGIFVGIIKFISMPVDLFITILHDIWEE